MAVTVVADQLLVVVGVLDQLAWSSALNVIVVLLPRVLDRDLVAVSVPGPMR